jgi:hypothetical protein
MDWFHVHQDSLSNHGRFITQHLAISCGRMEDVFLESFLLMTGRCNIRLSKCIYLIGLQKGQPNTLNCFSTCTRLVCSFFCRYSRVLESGIPVISVICTGIILWSFLQTLLNRSHKLWNHAELYKILCYVELPYSCSFNIYYFSSGHSYACIAAVSRLAHVVRHVLK